MESTFVFEQFATPEQLQQRQQAREAWEKAQHWIWRIALMHLPLLWLFWPHPLSGFLILALVAVFASAIACADARYTEMVNDLREMVKASFHDPIEVNGEDGHFGDCVYLVWRNRFDITNACIIMVRDKKSAKAKYKGVLTREGWTCFECAPEQSEWKVIPDIRRVKRHSNSYEQILMLTEPDDFFMFQELTEKDECPRILAA